MLENNHYTFYVLNDVTKVKQQIDENPFGFKTCKEIFEKVTNATEKTLEKAFKELYGCSVKTYLVKKRLEASKEYLKEVRSVKLTAIKCFYKSQSTYCTAFKKEFGMTPSGWLNALSRETTKAIHSKAKPINKKNTLPKKRK